MSAIFEGRSSDSTYVEMIWRGQAGTDYFPICPADVRWNMLLLKQDGKVKVTVEGPLTREKAKTQREGTEWLVVKFKLGTFLPIFPIINLLDTDVILPGGVSKTFWLNGSTWQYPDFDNVETFVDKLVRGDLLLRDPIVNAVLLGRSPDMSFRTVRRRFLRATGLTHRAIFQIERARQAAALLEQGVSILDAVEQAGYADQPHMTRAFRRFIGQTPAQIARVSAAV